MTADFGPFPDVEVVLVDLLSDLGETGTLTPANLQDVMPFIRVQRVAGADDKVTDRATVAIDSFAATRPAAVALAEAVRQRLISHPNPVPGVGTLDFAVTVTGPNELPWADTQSIRRFTATYRLSVRRRR